MFKQYYALAGAVFLLGLFPTFFLPVLQLALVLLLIGLFVNWRGCDRAAFSALFEPRYIAFAQFCVFFFINAALYPVWEGSRVHHRPIALESWSISLLCLIVLGLWLNMQRPADIKRALIQWLPAGLSISFAAATLVVVFGDQGPRVPLFTPNALVPPFWFLTLTMTSFAWFFEMSRAHRIWRLGLFVLAGVMAVYGGARLIMLAWMLCAVALTVWFLIQVSAKRRLMVLMRAGLSIAICAVGIVLVDALTGAGFVQRMAQFSQVDFTYESISAQFPRLQIWIGALSLISDNALLGIGQVNEKFAMNLELEWERWFRAHQTYFSYLLAGGPLALISGLLMQSPVLAFLARDKRLALFPVFLGLGVVVTLNCLTDSIFQSAVSLQAYMVITLFFLKARDAKSADPG